MFTLVERYQAQIRLVGRNKLASKTAKTYVT